MLILFEGVCLCYSRHPWDVRVKVGSERKFASSDKFAKVRQISVSLAKIRRYHWLSFPRGPSKIGRSIGRLTPKKSCFGSNTFGAFFVPRLWFIDSNYEKWIVRNGKWWPQFWHFAGRCTYMWKLRFVQILHYRQQSGAENRQNLRCR